MIRWMLRSLTLLLVLSPTWGLSPSLGIAHGQVENAIPGTSLKSEVFELQTPILKLLESTALPVEVAGVVEELSVQEGTRVKQGELIGRLRSSATEALIQQIQAKLALARKRAATDLDLKMARNNQAVAQTEYERAIRANERVPGTYPRNDIDRLRLVFDQTSIEIEKAQHDRDLAELEVQVAMADLTLVEEQLGRHDIRSPVSGLVVNVAARTGEWAELGTELVRVVRLDRLRVEGFLKATEANLDLVGALAEIQVEGLSGIQRGKVVFVSPEVNSVNGLVRVFIEVQNETLRLRPGMKLDVQVHSEDRFEVAAGDEPTNAHE